MSDINLQQSKNNPTTLMESIRKNPPSLKSIDDIVSLLNVRSSSVLRSCVDKVLMNMSDIRTLRDVIKRLRSVCRTNGLRFKLPSYTGPETKCNLASEMFSVEILLGTSNHDQSPTVVDVSIQHFRDDYRSCPHLVNILRAGKFLELSEHLKGLSDMYLTSVNRQMRTRVYLALQSLEADLVKMSQVYIETHKDSSGLEIVLNGTVGLLTPRVAGEKAHLTYYLSPYDLLDMPAKFKVSPGEIVPKEIGLHAEVGIEQKNAACNLPISPLIFNKHSIDKSGVPRFLEVSQHNSTLVQACFVLYLKPAIPVVSQMAEIMRRDTNLMLFSEGQVPTKYLSMLNAEKETYKIELDHQTYEFHLNNPELKGSLVSKIYFTHPGHVMKILGCLRQQAHLNTLLSSCIRNIPKDPNNNNSNGKHWYFDISCSPDINSVNITLENPLCNGTASLEIQLDQQGFSSCKIYTGRGDPPLCTDQFVTRVLQKCSSIPITMKKLIEQSKNHPRKESDINRIRPPALFGVNAHPVAPRAPTILTPVHRPPIPKRRPSATLNTPSADPMTTTPFPFSPPSTKEVVGDGSKKVTKNPMLVQLLNPSTNTNANRISEPAVQTKNHPMLMGLLSEPDTDSDLPTVPHSNVTRGGKSQLPIGYQTNTSHGIMGGNPNQSPYNTGHSGALMGMISQSPSYTMDPHIPVPTSHHMPPPSYPSHQFNSQSSIPNLNASHQSPVSTPQQFQIPNSLYSSQPSPKSFNMDDITGPLTPTYPMMSPSNLMSPGMAQNHGPASNRGRRGSRQKSRSIESQHSMGGDFPSFDIPTPTSANPISFDSQMSIESDDLLSFQNRTGMTPGRRPESMSPAMSPGGHTQLQHTNSMKSLSEGMINVNQVTRSLSVGGGKGARSMMSPSSRNLKTPTLPDSGMMMLGSPPLIPGDLGMGQMQRGLRKSYEGPAPDMSALIGGRAEFFRTSLSSTSPGTGHPMSAGSSVHEQEMDPFSFDENNVPSKISMPESAAGGTISISRANKPSSFQGVKFGIATSSVSNTGASDTLRELAKSRPSLMRELTGDDATIKSEPTTLQRLIASSTIGLSMPTITTTHGISTMGPGFDPANRFPAVPNVTDKGLVRQNAVDKQTVLNKIGEGKSEKTVKRRNSGKADEAKPVAKKRGRPPSTKDYGGKRKKAETTTIVAEDGSGTKSIMLNIQLSSTGAPISSTTKTKQIGGSTPPQKNAPAASIPVTTTPGASTPAMAAPSTTSATDLQNFVDLEKYLKSQEELQSRRKRELKEKKALSSSPSSQLGGGKSSSAKQSSGGISSNSGPAPVDKPPMLLTNIKQPGSMSPRTGTGPAVQKRPRKNSIKDVIENLHVRISTVASSNPLVSPTSNAGNKQGPGKDANSNILNKSKSTLASPSYQKLTTGNSGGSKAGFKSASDDKFPGKGGVAKPVRSMTPKPVLEQGSSKSATPGLGGVLGIRDFSMMPQQMRKDGKSGTFTMGGQSQEEMNTVLMQIRQEAAATAAKPGIGGSINKIPAKLPRQTSVKVRSVTPTPLSGTSAPQKKSTQSQILKAHPTDVNPRHIMKPMGGPTLGKTSPPIKKSPMRAQTVAGLPSRPSSASSIEAPSSTCLPKPLSAPTISMLARKSQSSASCTGDQQTFVTPSISPTPKRTTSPQIPRTTSPLTRFDDKEGLKGIANRKPSHSNSRIPTPIPTAGNPQSPDDRLIIDDPNLPNPVVVPPSLSRDEQMPVFLPGNRANERQSPERTVRPSPMSPPSASGKAGVMRRASTPRSTLTASPSLMSISSASVADSPCAIDDALMDEAVKPLQL